MSRTHLKSQNPLCFLYEAKVSQIQYNVYGPRDLKVENPFKNEWPLPWKHLYSSRCFKYVFLRAYFCMKKHIFLLLVLCFFFNLHFVCSWLIAVYNLCSTHPASALFMLCVTRNQSSFKCIEVGGSGSWPLLCFLLLCMWHNIFWSVYTACCLTHFHICICSCWLHLFCVYVMFMLCSSDLRCIIACFLAQISNDAVNLSNDLPG